MILFVAPPFAGHLDRMIPLAQAARGAGYNCHFVTGPRRLNAVHAAGFTGEAPASLPDGLLEDIAEGHGQIHGHPWRAFAQLRQNLVALPALTDDLLGAINRHNARLIVADSIALMAGPAARTAGIPWITTLATPLALEGGGGVPSYLGGLSPMSGPVGAVRDWLGHRIHRVTKRLAFQIVARSARDLLPNLYRPDGTEAIYSPQAILGFGMTELEFPRAWPPAFRMIGPVHGPVRDGPPLSLPRDGGPRIFATLGTHLPWARPAWEAGIVAMARARPNWHITLTRGGQPGPPLPELANLLVVPFADYTREVPRHDVVIHHGGSGIAYAAIEAARPSLVVPQDFDQFDYAARIACFGLGLRAPSLVNGVPLVERLLTEKWPALAQFAQASSAYDPQGSFLETVARLYR